MDTSPILISMRTASAAMVVTFFLGLLLAKLVAGLRRKEWRMILDGILTLPLVLPPTVAGFFLLYIFGVRRPVGKFFLDFFSVRIAFSWSATVLAAAAVSLPLMYRSARGALEQVDPDLIYAARTLGLSEWRIFWRVSFPTALPGIASGAVLAFARGLGEFGATAMIAGNIAGKTRTLPLAIYSAVSAGDMDEAYRYVLIIVIFSFLVVVLMNYLSSLETRPRRAGRTGGGGH
ncbi:MAG: molybdate ABC transporter permease subunit [Treponema sp.]|jgi:molybdate transport system permease protein|nr:molybdate ABC transporter permease subunit [Treponema sp.]